jgi:hypothetical protein
MTAERPQPPPDPPRDTSRVPDGFVLKWSPDEDWRLATEEERKTMPCRRPGCKRTPVAVLMRRAFHKEGVRHVRWLYCDQHLYGRRISIGRVEVLKAFPAEEDA